MLLRRGDPTGAGERLSAAVTDATAHRLPHQLQRVIRVTGHALPAIRECAEQGLQGLRQDMAA
ncbi:hypothetical protein [Streptomyces sp. NPDC021212]|uniref:hypothetical protein n=1 Tax=Streptomyces sp. NPDC021212 TaxID=3365118 RepID=UPI0037A418CB